MMAKMLVQLLIFMLQTLSVRAIPTQSSHLSVPVSDILSGNLSSHTDHPSYNLYTQWLDSTGSFIKQDPKAALAKFGNIVSIDCHDHLKTCLYTSQLAFADIVKSSDELERLEKAIELHQLEGDGGDELAPTKLAKRSLESKNLLASLHYKTYSDLGEDNPSAGFQHYM
jgi:hypothetical protein